TTHPFIKLRLLNGSGIVYVQIPQHPKYRLGIPFFYSPRGGHVFGHTFVIEQSADEQEPNLGSIPIGSGYELRVKRVGAVNPLARNLPCFASIYQLPRDEKLKIVLIKEPHPFCAP